MSVPRAGWALLFVSLAASPAHADGDYQPDNRAWNGLSRLAGLGRGMGLVVRATAQIDWNELDRGDTLLLLYPTRKLDPGHLAAFLRGGGNLILGDDFGSGSPVLARLGLLRDEQGVHGDQFYRDLPYAPIARPVLPDHPLAQDVEQLIANHAAILPETSDYDVVFALGPQEGLVASGRVGPGRLVALSDPSVLINRMLEFDGNLQFAVNLLRFTSEGKAGRRLYIMTGEFGFLGTPPRKGAAGSTRERAKALLGDINRALDVSNEYVLTEAGAKLVSGVTISFVLLLALAALPFRQRLQAAATFLHQEAGPQPPLVRKGDYAPLAGLVKDTFYARLARALDDEHAAELSDEALCQRVEAEYGTAVKTAVRELLPILHSTPSQKSHSAAWPSPRVDKNKFLGLKRRVDELYRSLDGA